VITDEDTGQDTGGDDGGDEGKALRALRDLINEGGWASTDGGPAMQVYIRAWPDNSADNLMFSDARHAWAERVNHNGEPVWQLVGTVSQVVAELGALPKPDAPGAPRTVLPRHDTTDRDM
jgi:hypothetical protein